MIDMGFCGEKRKQKQNNNKKTGNFLKKNMATVITNKGLVE